MLKLLEIENIAVIEKASVSFSGGLNVLTGETGAGKSIVIDSINAVTGQKTSRELLRTGAAHAFVSALFEDAGEDAAQALAGCGVPVEEDGSILLQRTLYKDGKNLCRINGAPVTVSMLKSVGETLINIHGQRDSQALLDDAKHIGFLDSFAGLTEKVAAYSSDYGHLREIKRTIRSLRTDEAEKARRIDLLTWQINELEEAAVVPGERDELHRKKNILTNSMKLSAALSSALHALSGDGDGAGAASLLSQAAREIASVASVAKGLDAVAATLEETESTVADAAAVIDDVLGQLDSVEGTLDAVDERLDTLYRLSKKYGATEEEMLSFLENARRELELITLSDEKAEQLTAEAETLLASCEKQAAALSTARKKSAKQLSSAVERELAFLNMPSCRFVVELVPSELCETGADRVTFLISANAGEEPKPLGRVASGGELSRIMLALKNVLSAKDSVDTLIFDEIDAGVSGEAASRIAVKLSQVARRSQVICITHLAQIAAFADEHLFLRKEEIGGKTYTRITSLNDEGRVRELARISYGEDPGETQLLSAGQMLAAAREKKVAGSGE
ncbi:MAG: DNA repair protein RecN [Clostridia bacterium]|nr:DNA repair protein RecN [Clostridia bacterium]